MTELSSESDRQARAFHLPLLWPTSAVTGKQRSDSAIRTASLFILLFIYFFLHETMLFCLHQEEKTDTRREKKKKSPAVRPRPRAFCIGNSAGKLALLGPTTSERLAKPIDNAHGSLSIN
jgi:hypothetical protein